MPPINNQLIIFIKSPVPGQCKTRLIPFLSAENACDFYQQMVLTCINKLKTLSSTDIALYVYPDTSHPFIKSISKQNHFSVYPQQGDNLGERMYHAMQTSLKTYQQCVLIGTDCPIMDTIYINKAFNTLKQHDIVIGPAEDGGYVLIGARKISECIFNNIDWGSAAVLQQSLQQMKNTDFSITQLNALWDIDEPADYLRYQTLLDNKQQDQYE